jgi:hypothetical protein
MTNITIPHNFTPREYQFKLFNAFDSGIKNILLRWCRQIGKDTCCWALMVREAVRVPGNYFYIFPTSTDAKRALWEKIMDDGSKLLNMLPDGDDIKIGDKKLIQTKSNMEMKIELFNGSTIRVLGCDAKEDKIRGITPQGVVFSEFAFSQFGVYKAMQPALANKVREAENRGCWQILNSTPNGRNHFYDMYMGLKESKDWFVSTQQCFWPEKEGYIHIHEQSYFDDLVNSGIMTWEDIEREYGCSFEAGLKGSFYAEDIEKARESNRIGNYIYDSSYPVYTGWDVGVYDQTVVWFFQVIGNSTIFIDYKAWDIPLGASGYVGYLAEKPYKYEEHYLPHDAANRRVGQHNVVSTLDLLDEALSNCKKMTGIFISVEKPHNKQHAIDLVRTQFPTYCFDKERCRDGIRHIELYHRKYDKKKQTFSKDPSRAGNHSHTADALQSCSISINGLCKNLYYNEPKLDGLIDFDSFTY